jgi:hypothetical protein
VVFRRKDGTSIPQPTTTLELLVAFTVVSSL